VTVLNYFTLDPASLSEFTNQPNPTFFAVSAENFAFSGTPLLTLSGGELSVTFTPVPEPGMIMGMAGIGMAVVWIRRRRENIGTCQTIAC